MDCLALLEQVNQANTIGNSICDLGQVTVQNALGNDVVVEYNSDVCQWDGRDCCQPTCMGSNCGSIPFECTDPNVVMDICEAVE